MDHITLPSGGTMPIVGYGTWQAKEEELEKALEAALEAGYRHIDTAAAYENEHVVGRVIGRWLADGKLTRDELFIVTKVPPVGTRPEGVKKFLSLSLEYLKLDYIDLYLVHTPFALEDDGKRLHPFDEEGKVILDTTTDLEAVWKAMEEEKQAGRVKAIGVSNYNEKQLRRTLEVAQEPLDCLQVELHAYFQQREMVEFCREREIPMCAYSPLGSRGSARLFEVMGVGKELPDLMSNPTVLEIADKYSKTAAQILLRHTVQKGIAVIPKSTNPERIQQNIEIFDFELSEDDVTALNNLDQGESARVVDFSFFRGLAEGHPEFPF